MSPRKKSYPWIMVLVGVAMGVILAVQFKSTSVIQEKPTVDRPAALVQELEQAQSQRDDLQKQVDQMRVQLDEAAEGPELEKIKFDLSQIREQAGLTELTGTGVEVTLNDSNNALQPGANPNFYVLHDIDVLSILNELKAAGSKAVAINGQRIIATTEVRCIGPTILVNKNQRLTTPFVVSALGDPDTLIGSLKMKGGVIDNLKVWGIQAEVKKVDKITIPAYNGSISMEFAKPKK